MKKLFISADIEGVCGIADWRETELSDPQSAYDVFVEPGNRQIDLVRPAQPLRDGVEHL